MISLRFTIVVALLLVCAWIVFLTGRISSRDANVVRSNVNVLSLRKSTLPTEFAPSVDEAQTRAQQQHLWRQTFRTHVPASCFKNEPQDHRRMTLLPGFKEFMYCTTRPRILYVDEATCSVFGRGCVETPASDNLEAVHAMARQACQAQLTARSIGGACVASVVEQHHFDPKQMSLMTYPGLRAVPMWSRAETESWPEVRELERNARAIKNEFDALVMQGHLAVHPEPLAEQGRWRVNTLWSAGREHEAHTALAAVTARVWRSIELASPRAKDMAFGLVYFSVVMPNSTILPHTGITNTRIRLHLGLHIPDGASIIVDDVDYGWIEQKVVVLDDSYVHSVANKASTARAILLADIWHPELLDAERQGLRKLMGDVPQRVEILKDEKALERVLFDDAQRRSK